MLDADGKFLALLSWQLSGFKSVDPGASQQKAISINVLKTMLERAKTMAEIAVASLAMGAFFFACCSYKYSKA
jgi:hypothetical protein